MPITLRPGDGIGPEITAATIEVLRAAARSHQLSLDIVEDVTGHASLARYGTTVRPDLLDKVRAAQAEFDGAVFQLGFNRRFDPHFQALRQRVQDGAVGELGWIGVALFELKNASVS